MPTFRNHTVSLRSFLSFLGLLPLAFFLTYNVGQAQSALATSSPAGQINSKTSSLEVSRILSMTIDASINPATYSYLMTGYHKAKDRGVSLIVLKMNTPGGLVSTTKQILTLIGESPIPTLLWVAPEGASATSAGAIIASGAHILVMAQGTNIGAATPIQLHESADKEPSDLKNKAINDLVALVQSLAEARGRNKEAYRQIITEASSFPAQEALEKRVIDGIIDEQAHLCRFINGRIIHLQGQATSLSCQAPLWENWSMDLGQTLLNVLADPNMAYILFLLGVGLLYLEMQMAGTFIAGTLGIISLILAGIGFQVLPLNFGALGLIILAFILFFLEIFITSFGLLTLAGIVSLVVGSLFLYSVDDAYLSLSKSLIVAVSGSISLFAIGVAIFLLRDMRRTKKPRNFYSLAGKTATVLAALPSQEEGVFRYQVKVGGETWTAKSRQVHAPGSQCQVQEDRGKDMTLVI